MTNKNLIERLKSHSQHCAEAYKCEEYLPMAEFWEKYEALSGEAAALIEQQEAVIASLIGALTPFSELAWAEPGNAGELWTLQAVHFRNAAKAILAAQPPTETN